MRSKISVLTFMFLLVFAVSLPVYAQKETGSIVGKITDMDGLPLEGVTVTLVSPAFGDNITYSDMDGHYRFPVVKPGVYEVTAALDGFQTAIRKDVRMFVGNTITVNMFVGQTLEQAVEVSGDTPLVDATTTASSKTVPIEIVENLPKFTDALDLFTLTPGVNDLSYVAYGAGGSQANAYWFDGVDISNPVDGDFWIYPNYNWIEEVQVIGIGAPAEYGGFSGVITNTVSRSGSNEFHGLFETFYQNESLTGNNVDDPLLGPDTVDLYTDNTVQVSGRIIRDKLWFFTSGQYYYSKYAPFGYPPDGSGALSSTTQPRILNKMTYKVDQNNTVQGFVQWDHFEIDGGSASRFYLPEATSLNSGPEWFWNAAWVSLFSPETVMDVRYSGYNSQYDTTGRNGDIPQHCDANTGICSENYYGFRFRDRERNQVNGALSHYARDFIKGSHDFKFGIEYEHSNADTIDGYNGDAYYYDGLGLNPYDPTSPNWYRTLWEGYDSFSRVRRTTVFAQDDWHISDKLDISVGVRYDHNHAFLAEDSNFEYTTKPIAPRVGFVYDVKGDQSSVIKAHYGQYYDKAITFYIDGIDNFGDRTQQYWYGSYWGTFSFTPGTSAFVVDPDLKQTYVDQFTVGIDQLVGGGVTLSAHYIYRDFKNIIEDVDITGVYEPVPFINPVTGEPMTVFNQVNPDVSTSFFITNPDNLFRNYHAVEVYGGKRFTKDFTLNGSVVWSRSRGNTDNTSGGADGFTVLLDDPNYLINADGKPTYDPTWEIKVTGFYEMPWDILTSFYYRHFSGTTWTPTFQTPRGLLNQGRVTILAEPRGSERLEGRNVVDMRFEKAFPISTGDLKFTFDFFNIFNTGYVLDLDEDFTNPNTYLLPDEFTAPRELRIGVRYQF